ncbi:MAG: HD domain-containing protein, partial [Clostridiaceae bacterium]|nr:HD domain-containing protein [Clostridiaceae bacterium]
EVMKILNEYLERLDDAPDFSEGSQMGEMTHAYGTAYISAAIAQERGLNPELAFIIGLMHDAGRIAGNLEGEDHGKKGAELTETLLARTGKFSKEETDTIFLAIYNHSNKKDEGSGYEEVIKDADVVERILITKETYKSSKKKRKRLKASLEQLGLKLKEKK